MTGYRTWLIEPPGYIHIQALAELRDSLDASLKDIDLYDEQGAVIILGAHLHKMIGRMMTTPADIIFNTEVHGSPWFTKPYLDLLANHQVWDYSTENIEWLEKQGIDAEHCPIGYHPCLERIQRAGKQDIDVLFYGSMTPRREAIWKEVCAIPDIEAVHLFGIYGAERDALIVRSKIVLDLKAYDQSPRNDVRLSYLWANNIYALREEEYTLEGLSVAGAISVLLKWRPQLLHEAACWNGDAFRQHLQADYLRPLLMG